MNTTWNTDIRGGSTDNQRPRTEEEHKLVFSATYEGEQPAGTALTATNESARREGDKPAATSELKPFGATSEGHSLQFEKDKYRLASERFLPQHHTKDLIVLHFTAGTSCASAFNTWQVDARRIATAYGVDPDGTIVEFFPPEAWAYHLGIKGTSRHDHRSIGIEIANAGPLRPDPETPKQLNWWPNNWRTRYCSLDETHRFVAEQYRGIPYFAVRPEDQQKATGALVRYLCDRFGIPREASSEARRGVFNPVAFADYRGVASHSNFRQDKWDVGPAFRWEHLDF